MFSFFICFHVPASRECSPIRAPQKSIKPYQNGVVAENGHAQTNGHHKENGYTSHNGHSHTNEHSDDEYIDTVEVYTFCLNSTFVNQRKFANTYDVLTHRTRSLSISIHHFFFPPKYDFCLFGCIIRLCVHILFM